MTPFFDLPNTYGLKLIVTALIRPKPTTIILTSQLFNPHHSNLSTKKPIFAHARKNPHS
jgi:hypothetical protein